MSTVPILALGAAALLLLKRRQGQGVAPSTIKARPMADPPLSGPRGYSAIRPYGRTLPGPGAAGGPAWQAIPAAASTNDGKDNPTPSPSGADTPSPSNPDGSVLAARIVWQRAQAVGLNAEADRWFQSVAGRARQITPDAITTALSRRLEAGRVSPNRARRIARQVFQEAQKSGLLSGRFTPQQIHDWMDKYARILWESDWAAESVQSAFTATRQRQASGQTSDPERVTVSYATRSRDRALKIARQWQLKGYSLVWDDSRRQELHMWQRHLVYDADGRRLPSARPEAFQ